MFHGGWLVVWEISLVHRLLICCRVCETIQGEDVGTGCDAALGMDDIKGGPSRLGRAGEGTSYVSSFRQPAGSRLYAAGIDLASRAESVLSGTLQFQHADPVCY